MQYLYIFVGGALGTLIRFCLSMLNEGSTFPLGTFVANLLGAFLMGSIGALSVSLFKTHPNIKKGLTTGLIGALTTFSTFQFELITLFNQHHFILFTVYGVTSYILGILSCYLGVKIGGRFS
ncbi:fluoride efflux transporter CrcB [Staphylococcus epidermidis]|uniref:fluoride efflux transporter CrcB n=1 Tax=Staphylococcus epidermidis TaxID=1282 RepID=UPI0036D427AC